MKLKLQSFVQRWMEVQSGRNCPRSACPDPEQPRASALRAEICFSTYLIAREGVVIPTVIPLGELHGCKQCFIKGVEYFLECVFKIFTLCLHLGVLKHKYDGASCKITARREGD